MKKRVLIIKHGTLGDFIRTTGAIADIRNFHQYDHITLLTTKRLKSIAYNNPNIDALSFDALLPLRHITYSLNMAMFLKNFHLVYDLESSKRTSFYRHLARGAAWCGTAKGSKFRQDPHKREHMHIVDAFADQIRLTGVRPIHLPDVSYAVSEAREVWEETPLKPQKFIALIPGSSHASMAKRWPFYGPLAKELVKKGWQVALCGGAEEESLLHAIQQDVPQTVNLSGLSLNEHIDVFRKCAYVIGNDTGPTHLAAASGAKGIAIFGAASDFKTRAPRNHNIEVVQADDLVTITPHSVIQVLERL